MTTRILHVSQLELLIDEGVDKDIVTSKWAKEAKALLNYEASDFFHLQIDRAVSGKKAAIRHCHDILTSRGQILDVLETIALNID